MIFSAGLPPAGPLPVLLVSILYPCIHFLPGHFLAIIRALLRDIFKSY